MHPFPLRLRGALALLALAAAAPAWADPVYRSAFDAVRPHGDPRPIDWRAANERVGLLGGHAGHLRSARAGEDAAAHAATSLRDPGRAAAAAPRTPDRTAAGDRTPAGGAR